MFSLVCLLLASWAAAADVTVHMLDVGQGDSILLRTPAGKTVLIDAGDRGAGMLEKLRAHGVDHLDLVVATHPHADHIGEMQKVIEALPPRVYVDSGQTHPTKVYASLLSALEGNPAIQYRTATPGMVFNLDDGAKLELLWPNPKGLLTGTRSDLNSNSVVTRLTHGDDCFLFTGDAEEPTEAALLEAGVGQCDVLKVAHHGSRHSSGVAFLAAVKPSVALVSAGAGNRYSHPGVETLARLDAVGATVYRTDQDGEVTVVSSGKGLRVLTERARPAPQTEVPNAQAAVAVATAGEAHAPEGSAEPEAAACAFPGSSRSEVFHGAGCRTAAKISEANQMCYESREAALKAGKRSAGCCHP